MAHHPAIQNDDTKSLPDGVPTVVTFGSTGAGKSSVINMLPDDPEYPPRLATTEFSTSGVTNDITTYHKSIKERPFRILDTIGTGESQGGANSTHVAIKSLYDHLTSSPNGVHLVVVVVKAGRLSTMDDWNYLIARLLFGDEVPMMLVLTHLEGIDDRKTWWAGQNQKGKYFSLSPEAVVAVVSSPGPDKVFQSKYEESKSALHKSLDVHLKRAAGSPGYKLEPKRRVNFVVSRITSFIRDTRRADRLQAELLRVLQNFSDVDEPGRAQSIASDMQPTAPRPVLVIVGAHGRVKNAIVRSLLEHDTSTDLGDSEMVAAFLQDRVRHVDKHPIRIIVTPGIQYHPPPFSSSPTASARMLFDSLTIHQLGVRCVVLVAEPSDSGQLSVADTNHYHLVRRIAGDRVPICLMTAPSSATNSRFSGIPSLMGRPYFQKRVTLPSPRGTQQPNDKKTTRGIRLGGIIGRFTSGSASERPAVVEPETGTQQTSPFQDAIEKAIVGLMKLDDYRVNRESTLPALQGLLESMEKLEADKKREFFDKRLAELLSDFGVLGPTRNPPPKHPSSARRTGKPINVIFVGETGAGMSSIINIFQVASDTDAVQPKPKSDLAPVGHGLISCTTVVGAYARCLPRNSPNQQIFMLWDTPGFNGTYIPDNSVIMALAMTLQCADIDLIALLVRPGGLNHRRSVQLYKALEALSKGKIPFVLVGTHAGPCRDSPVDERVEDDWWDETQRVFDEAGATFVDVAWVESHVTHASSVETMEQLLLNAVGTPGPNPGHEGEGDKTFKFMLTLSRYGFSAEEMEILRTAMSKFYG